MAKYSAAELQRELAELSERVHGYHIIYDATPAKGSDANAGTYVHRELAAEAPSRFLHWSAKGTSLYTPEQDPLQQRLLVDRDVAIVDYPADRAFIHSNLTDGCLPGSAPREIMFLALGWWPLKGLKTPQLIPGTALVLPDVAASNAYRVWPHQSLVGDRWCHVLEHPNRDRLWLDTGRGSVIMAREVLNPHTGKVGQRIEGDDVAEMAAGIWTPRLFRNVVFEADGTRVKVDSELLIRYISVNARPPTALFEFRAKAGSIELKNGHFAQCEAGGLDFLDETTDRLKQFPRYAALQPSSGGGEVTIVVVVTGLVTFGVVMTLQITRRSASTIPKLRSGIA